MEGKILVEINEFCTVHVGGRALVITALRTGYYWRSLRDGIMNMAKNLTNARSAR